ncbi:hypothetical protein E1B28_005294 [Marasmius oreades]|uniref:Uncharacterized protein n=1 Tax=Marasmius oreades TaxID=181124 RepID=A0A9P7V0B3_9AGAR|nr:uncharacterized protein E1B28_005294 [Marasmius oreades]KAG7097986.1 hypothetical protein E1B28_005294 [Marasmius oreades]
MDPPSASFILQSTLFILTVTALVVPTHAQKTFTWGFSNKQIPTDLLACTDFPITIEPATSSGNLTGIPPYYMIGYAINGISRTTFVGSNASSVKWTVDFPIGTKLVLSVFDSEGTSGGISPNEYTVVGGSSTTCIINDAKRDFILTSNSTGDTINTCDPWGLRIKGGVKPYSVTLMQISSPSITNVTMGPNDDAYTYRMRGAPGDRMIAVVNDITGRFAYQAATIMPKGSTDVDCPGLSSMSGSTGDFDRQVEEAHAAAEAKDRHKHTAIIAGTVVAVVALFFATLTMWYFLWYRPHPIQTSKVEPYCQTHTDGAKGSQRFKAQEAGVGGETVQLGHGQTSSESSDQTPINCNPSLPYVETSEAHTASLGTTVAGQLEVIIQHRDGGTGCVRELPPPYVDRTLQEVS